jgi:glycosyltransferase involved in cell wall biosynthesis
MNKSFSVAMCVYGKDNADHFKEAIFSILDQTVAPQEVVLAVDGPIPSSIQDVINFFVEKYSTIFKVVYSEENKGYAHARQLALENCTNELVALMDSDDVSVKNRFELQLKAFEEHDDVSVIGGYITEFSDNINNISGMRKTALSSEDCLKYAKMRTPVNNISTMYKKSHVMEVGGYQVDYFPEDYYLCVRLLMAGFKLMNIPENLCFARVNTMLNRRGGIKYYKKIKKFYQYLLKCKFIGVFRYLYNLVVRLFVHVITPTSLRSSIYKVFARNKISAEKTNP